MTRKQNTDSRTGFSLEIQRGEEEPIYSSAVSNRKRPGSRAVSSRASSTTSVRTAGRNPYYSRPPNGGGGGGAGGIQILQDGFDDDQEWMVEDFTDDDGHDLESIGSESPLNNFSIENYQPPPRYDNQKFSEKYRNNELVEYREVDNSPSPFSSVDQTEQQQQRQMVLRARGDVVEVDTDEENDIVSKIRKEITQAVRGEIKEELKQLTNNGAEKEGEEEKEIDPRVKEALLQMRKFDRILEKRVRRERRVKRERISLQKRLREELDELNRERPADCKSTKDELVNTERFLSLPPSIARWDREIPEHSDDDDLDWTGAPVFATEPQFDANSSKSGRSKRSGRAGMRGASDDASSTAASDSTQQTGAGSSTNRSGHRKRRAKQATDGKDGKDFIQRNIDLAADAGNTVAMTDDEKKRLADILEDLDTVEEDLLEADNSTIYTQSVALRPGEGFSLDSTSHTSMVEIDRKLERLMGQEEFNSILNAPSNVTYDTLQLFSRTHSQSNPTGDHITEIGERALQETREYRDQQRRLADIEHELANLSTAVQSEIESPTLSDQQLHVLLDQCNKMMSRATAETDSLSEQNSPRSAHSTARESVASSVHPPLDGNTLRALLDQARSEGIVSRSERHSEQPYQPDESSTQLISDNQRASLLVNPRTTSSLAAPPLENA